MLFEYLLKEDEYYGITVALIEGTRYFYASLYSKIKKIISQSKVKIIVGQFLVNKIWTIITSTINISNVIALSG